MNNDLMVTTIEMKSKAKYLLDSYPELAKYDAIRRLVTLATEWDNRFENYIGKDKESRHA